MEDGQLVCSKDCSSSSIYRFTELGKCCVKKCKDDEVLEGGMCVSKCTNSTDLPYNQNGRCVKKCPNFVSDSVNKVCLDTCESGFFRIVGDTMVCADDCEGSLLYKRDIDGQMTGCYDRCSDEYMGKDVFEALNHSTCVSECESKYYK